MNAKPTAYPILGHKTLKRRCRNRTEGNIGEKPLPVTAKTRPKPRKNIIKYKGDVNERKRGRDSNPLFSILDTTILTDFRLHAHSL